MMKWTFSVVAAGSLWACGGSENVTDNGNGGGQGGADSSDSSSSGGSVASGGSMVVAPTCSDDKENQDETDVDCGGETCDPCAADASCLKGSDCESGVCSGGECQEASCGDGVKNGDEDCDSEGEDTEECNADCTAAECGDGYVNEEAGELCEAVDGQGPWGRCNALCTYGVGLDGTWQTTNISMTDSPWEVLAASGEYLEGLQSFHYPGQDYIYDLTANYRYSIADDEWTPNPQTLPYATQRWANGAVDATSIWVPRDGSMHRFVIATEMWEEAAADVPNGSDEATGAVFDGEGNIWYADPDDALVRYTPASDAIATFSYTDEFPDFEVYETRIAYDPITNRIVFTGYSNDRFLRFDIDTEMFSEGSQSPGGSVRDNSCQDRSGGIYVGSDDDPGKMYRYDIENDDYTELPALPAEHDNSSTCVVSSDGYLYYATSENSDGEFLRLRLNFLEGFGG